MAATYGPAGSRARDVHDRALEHFADFLEVTLRATRGVPISGPWRNRMPRLFYQQALEDGAAIHSMFKHRYRGSARALLRPQFEACARAAWAQLIATDEQLEALAKDDKEWPPLRVVLSSLEGLDTNAMRPGGQQFDWPVWRGLVRTMHDFTHRGTRSIALTSHSNAAGGLDAVVRDELGLMGIAIGTTKWAALALLDDAGKHDEALALNQAQREPIRLLRELDAANSFDPGQVP